MIARKIKYDYPLPIFDVEDFPAKTYIPDTLYFKDTLIYQVISGVEKYELYRQLTSVETLPNNKTYRIDDIDWKSNPSKTFPVSRRSYETSGLASWLDNFINFAC